MKKMNTFSKFLLGSLILSLVSSCSMFSRRDNMAKDGKETVSREEYENLLSRYNALKSSTGGEQETKQERPSEEMTYSGPKLGVDETVSLTNDSNHLKQKEIEEAILASMDMIPHEKEIEKESELFKKSLKVFKEKQYDKALKMFQNLEKSKFAQIRVRSKFYIGEILFQKEEYDLAMQIFEEIAQKHAYSFYSVLTLERLSKCAEQLDLEEKARKYHSLYESLLGRKA